VRLFRSSPLSQIDRSRIRTTLADIDLLDQRVEEIDSTIAGFIVDRPGFLEDLDRLVFITGVSLVVGASLIAAIGDVTRFSHPKKLSSYFGLVPSTLQSGDSPAYHGRITKRGRTRSCKACFSL